MTAFVLLTTAVLMGADTADPSVPPAPPKTAPEWAAQPVEEYFAPFPFDHDGAADPSNLVPREAIIHLGTDFGRMGPGRHRVVWRDGRARVDLRGAGWAGLWHSTAGC
jgi:hypothetical protein